MVPKTPSIGINYCCETMRANQISVNAQTLTDQIQAGFFWDKTDKYRWAVPSIGTKRATPMISRAGFLFWLHDFWGIEEVIEP